MLLIAWGGRLIRRLGFEEERTPYEAQTHNARFWSEGWVSRQLYCLNCGAERLERLPNNTPVGDFVCQSCSEQYELKSKAGRLAKSVPDGAYQTMLQRLNSQENPSLILLGYDRDRRRVSNLAVIPKHFFIPSLIQKRKPLADTARRAGWIGCNILVDRVPEAGRVIVVKDGVTLPREQVLETWRRTCFLRDERASARGWLIEVLKCVEDIGRAEFGLADVYAFESRLRILYPGNSHVREKMRQQLQVLRDAGFIEFLGRGRYRRKLPHH
ncbi:MAG: DpnI domain-containing protein [Hyphomonadaceae bacterium]